MVLGGRTRFMVVSGSQNGSRTRRIAHTPQLEEKIRRGDYTVTMDTAFEDVIRHCRSTKRPAQSGTWITEEMIDCYAQLHEMGFAHSVEAWEEGQLVGGLYGVAIGTFFAGESMFQPIARMHQNLR